jgi:outer membrane protein TolC
MTSKLPLALCALALPLASAAAELPVVGPLVPMQALKPEPAPPADPDVPGVPDKLTLDDALRFALENSFAIRQARERLKEQEGLIVEVRADALPNVSASGRYTRDDRDFTQGLAGGRGYQDWTAGVYVRQVLYRGGAVGAALDAARTTREAAVLDLRAVVDEVLLQVRTRFADVLLARERIEVREQGVNLLREQLQTVRNRFEAGSVSQFEVLTAEVALANAQPPLINARNSFRIAVDELRSVLGYRGGFGPDLTKLPEFAGELRFDPVQFQLESSLAAARERRPELLRLEQIRLARESGVTVARSGYLPQLYLTAGYETRKLQASNAFSDSRDGWTAGLEGSWALFDGARTRGQVAQARARLNQARLGVSEQTLDIEVEVRRALSGLQEAAELAEAAGKVVGQAEEALRLADVRYRNGAATQLDVLQARVALTEAQLNRLEANYRHTVALATVRRAIGESNSPAEPAAN